MRISSQGTTERGGAFVFPLGVALLVVGLTFLVSISNFTVGFSIKLLKEVALGLGGVLSFGLPIVLILLGIICIVSAKRKVSFRLLLSVVTIYFLSLALITIVTPIYGEGYFLDYLQKRMGLYELTHMEEYINIAFARYVGIVKPLAGGGAIGMVIAYPIWLHLGSVWSAILLSFAILVTFFVGINYNPISAIRKYFADSQKKSAEQPKENQTEIIESVGDLQADEKPQELKGFAAVIQFIMDGLSGNLGERNSEKNSVSSKKQRSVYHARKSAVKKAEPAANDMENYQPQPPILSPDHRADTEAMLNQREQALYTENRKGQAAQANDLPQTQHFPTQMNPSFGGHISEKKLLFQENRQNKAESLRGHGFPAESAYDEKEADLPFNDSFDDFKDVKSTEKQPVFARKDMQDEWKPFGEEREQSPARPSLVKSAKAINVWQKNDERQQKEDEENGSLWDDEPFYDAAKDKHMLGTETFLSSEEAVPTSPLESLRDRRQNRTEKIQDVHTRAAFELPSHKITVMDDIKQYKADTLDGHTHTKPKGRQLELTIDQYVKPSFHLLRDKKTLNIDHSEEDRRMAEKVLDVLDSFKVPAQIGSVVHGPSITRIGVNLAKGTKVERLLRLESDIITMLEGKMVKITLPDGVFKEVGIELPNTKSELVTLKEVLLSSELQSNPSPTAVALGKNLVGESVVCEITAMPHLLIAGETGSGKSACINSIITSLLYRAEPKDVRMILVDPKQVEFEPYTDCPHLLLPIINDHKKTVAALDWLCEEMERRYMLLKEKRQRNIFSYNAKLLPSEEKLPYIIMIIDELSDLMITSGKAIELYLQRLTAKARAAGIYLILATQRPSVNVITGVIKANMPSRIAFKVTSNTDSRTILDSAGAEKLIGKGDMIFSPSGARPVRVQGCFITEEEVAEVMAQVIRSNQAVQYNQDIIDHINRSEQEEEESGVEEGIRITGTDEYLQEAIALAVESGQASISGFQRMFQIGYARAGRLIDEMEKRGIVSRSEGSKPRKTIMTREEYQRLLDLDDPRIQ